MELRRLDAPASAAARSVGWIAPTFEVIALDCEITAYAPDEGDERPLF